MAGALQDCPCCLPATHAVTGWRTNFTTTWQMLVNPNVGIGATGYPDDIYRTPGSTVAMDNIKIDPTNNFLYTSVGSQIRKWSATNFVTPVWTISPGTLSANNHQLIIDPLTGDIIFTPIISGVNRLYKVDSSGSLVYNVALFTGIGGPCCTDGSFIYMAGGTSVAKYLIGGTSVWFQSHGTLTRRGIACNATYVAVVSDRGTSPAPGGGSATQTVFVRDTATGALTWIHDHGARYWDCAYLSNGDLVCVGENISSVTMRCYDSSGAVKWNYNHKVGASVTATLYSITVDSSDNIYVVGDMSDKPGGFTTRKLDKNGNLIWSQDFGCGAVQGTGSGGNFADSYARGVAVNSAASKVYTCGFHYNFWRTF